MKKTNKSVTSVKKPNKRGVNESITSVKKSKSATNKSNTKVVVERKNESITSVGTKKSNKCNTKVCKPDHELSNKSNTVVEEQENRGFNESITLVETKDVQLFKNAGKIKAFEEMLGMKTKIAEIIEWYEKKHKNVVEIPELRINAKSLHGGLILKTYKIYESAVKKINDFIDKHPQFKQQDIISQALIEFTERYH